MGIHGTDDFGKGNEVIQKQEIKMQKIEVHLKLANNSIFVFKLLFRLLSPVEIKSLQPLGESLKLRLAFQFVGEDLRQQFSKKKPNQILSHLQQSHLGLDPLPLDLGTQLGSPHFARTRCHRLQRN